VYSFNSRPTNGKVKFCACWIEIQVTLATASAFIAVEPNAFQSLLMSSSVDKGRMGSDYSCEHGKMSI